MKVSDEEIRSAKRTDPTSFLASYGYTVKWEGKHGYIYLDSVKAFRITKCDDGHYVSCQNNGDDAIGDNIALVRYIDKSLSFRSAVEALVNCKIDDGYKNSVVNKADTAMIKRYPILQSSAQADIDEGRKYLIRERGISEAVLKIAEDQGAVKYIHNYVAFCGYDEVRNIRNISLRATNNLVQREYAKWNVKDSDKGYPMILKGDPNVVWIVEGGVDGLAVTNLYAIKNFDPPTVIVSGGALVLSFLDNVMVQMYIRRARVIWLAREREKDETTKMLVQKGFLKMMAIAEGRLKGYSGKVKVWEPPEGVKDLGEMNLKKLGLK
jgi:hypothetical protein